MDGVTEVSCEAKDASGKSSGNRTWNVGVPVSISTPEVILQDQHPLKISYSDSWDEDVTVRLSLSQGGQPSEIQEFHKGDSSQQVVSLSPHGIVPGPVNVWLEVVVGQFSFQHTIDIGIVKESTAPSITISSMGEFDGTMWRIGGQYSDPDGEPVTFTIEVGGQEIGQIVVSGNTWESEWIDLRSFSSGVIDVDVTGCDQSGKCTTSSMTVDIASVMEELVDPEMPDDADEVGESLPSSGVASLVVAISLAVLFRRRGL